MSKLVAAFLLALALWAEPPGYFIKGQVSDEFDYYPRHTRLEWAPVEGAASYSVGVDFCNGRRGDAQGCTDPQPLSGLMKLNPKTSGIEGTAYEFDFIGAQPGLWHVWAVDAQGREGFKSPRRLFTYLR